MNLNTEPFIWRKICLVGGFMNNREPFTLSVRNLGQQGDPGWKTTGFEGREHIDTAPAREK